MTTATIVKTIKRCMKDGGFVFVAGNGGSDSESHHLSSEFVTHGIRSMSLNNSATLTAIANDYSYKYVFSKQLQVLGSVGDIFIGLTTSGKSKNILRAYKTAKKIGMDIIDWPRKGKDTAEIQENQLHLMHLVYKKLI